METTISIRKENYTRTKDSHDFQDEKVLSAIEQGFTSPSRIAKHTGIIISSVRRSCHKLNYTKKSIEPKTDREGNVIKVKNLDGSGVETDYKVRETQTNLF